MYYLSDEILVSIPIRYAQETIKMWRSLYGVPSGKELLYPQNNCMVYPVCSMGATPSSQDQ
jgi:hypothetical protein